MNVVVFPARFGAGPVRTRRQRTGDLLLKWSFVLASSASTGAFLYGVGWAALQVL